MPLALSASLPPSPCVGVCRLDEASGLCLGCGRSGDEIAAWRDLDDASRAEVWQLLPERMAGLGQEFRLLPLAGAELADRLLATARNPWTVFAIGVQGAIAEFMRFPRDRAVVGGDAGCLLIQSGLGALRLEIQPFIRVFGFGPEGGAPDEVVLAVHRARLTSPPACTITELGPDEHAIREADRRAQLFDLGLDRPTLRFCIRTSDAELIGTLRMSAGQPFATVADQLVPLLLERHPHRVVISKIGRIEVSQPIGGRNGAPGTPEGPHTHLLPELLGTGRELAPDRDLPPDYAPAASIFPGPGTVELWCQP
jgi:predicted Fe-S protein YdhL (DUF1289 family)